MGKIVPDTAMRVAGGAKPAVKGGVMRTIGGALGGVAAVPAAVATGATAAQMAGAVATGTPEGRAAGKWIGDNVPGAKMAANALKPVQNYLRGKLGINQPKQATPVAKPAPTTAAAKPAAAPAPVAKPSAAPVAPAKQTFGQAFAAARKAAGGAGGTFTYNNKQFQTNIKGEKYSKAPTPVKTMPASPAKPEPTVDQPKPTAQSPGAATSSYKPSSPQTDTGYTYSVGGSRGSQQIGKTNEPSVADTDVKKQSTTDYSAKASTDFNKMRQKTGLDKQPIQESVQVGDNKYRIV